MINQEALNSLRNRFNGHVVAERFIVHPCDHSNDMIIHDRENERFTTVPINSIQTVILLLEDLFEENDYECLTNDEAEYNTL